MQEQLWFETHGDKHDATVVLLHGFTGSHLTWERLCSRLVENRFLVVPDLPGHGRSGAVSVTNMDDTSDSILRVLDLLGIRKTALLGYSLGGRIALHFAMKYQDKVSCLLLESASPGIQDSKERRAKDDSLAKDIEQNGLDWFVEEWENLQLFATQKNLNPEVIQGVRNVRLSHAASGLAMSLRSMGIGRMKPMWSELGRLEIPVLLIVGEKDEKFTMIAEEMKKRMINCAIKVMKNAGHATHLENPEMFEDIAKQFLDTCKNNSVGAIG